MRFPDIKEMKVAIYLRKSRADKERESRNSVFQNVEDTLDRHRKELLEFADDHRLNVVAVFKEVVSGENLYERTQMNALIEQMSKQKFQGVLVTDLDRLTRGSKIDQGIIERSFLRSNTLIITPDQVYDMNNRSDSFSVGFKTYMSHLELNETVRRLQLGRVRSTRDGRDVSPKPPYGYIKDKDKRLVPSSSQAHIVQEIFERFVIDEETPKEIAEDLTARGVLSPGGKPVWHVVTVHNILKREKYTGTQVFGIKQQFKDDGDRQGKYVPKLVRDKEKFVRSENTHEALIDRDTWIKAQLYLGANNKKKTFAKTNNPFKDVLVCSECGKGVHVHRRKSRSDAYYCRNKECETGQVSEDRLMQRFFDTIREKLEYIKKMNELTGKDYDKLEEKLERLIEYFESDATHSHKNQVLKEAVSEIKYTKRPHWRRAFFKIEIVFRYDYL